MKKTIVALAALLATTSISQADTRDFLTYEKAAKGVAACVELANKNKWAMSVVILDRSADILSSARMSNALQPSYVGANLKASSAVSWSMPTGDIEKFIADKPQFRAFPGLLTIDGGLPVFSKNKQLIGGVGVAGSSPINDKACAQAAIKAMS